MFRRSLRIPHLAPSTIHPRHLIRPNRSTILRRVRANLQGPSGYRSVNDWSAFLCACQQEIGIDSPIAQCRTVFIFPQDRPDSVVSTVPISGRWSDAIRVKSLLMTSTSRNTPDGLARIRSSANTGNRAG